jgi:hypothetical protein
MKTLFLFILVFSVSIFPQNIKKIKLLLENNSNLQKAYSLSIDLEHSISDKEGGLILFVDEKEFQSILNSGLNYEILIDDWKTYYHSLPKLTDVEKK